MWNIFSRNCQTNILSKMAVNVRSQARPSLAYGSKNIQQNTFSSLQEASDNTLIGDEVAEYRFGLVNNQLVEDDKLFFACSTYNPILIEKSYMQEGKNIEENIVDLQIKGYQSILAYPKRHVCDHQEPKRIQRSKNLVSLLQTNLLSELGYYGPREKQVAQELLNCGVIDFVRTDVQHENHVKTLDCGLQNEDISKHVRKCNIKNAALFTCKT